MDVIANESSAEQERMGGHVCASALLNTQSRNIECLPVLTFDHVVRNRGVLSRHQFCRTVAKDCAAAQGHVLLDDGRLALLLENQQVSGMYHAWFISRSRYEQ